MTIEEKAKAYDEAIERAKESFSYPSYPGFMRVDIIFPELKESEDEKMRAMAIKAVHAPEAQSCIKSWGINPDDVIAWLEKQKPVELSKSAYTNNKNVIEYADKYSHQIWEKLMDNYKRITNYSIGCNDVSDIVLNSIIDTYNWLEKQKSTNKVNWTELTYEDINTLEGLINNVHYEFPHGINE